EIRCTGLVWAGGQQTAPGRVTAQLRKRGDFIEWDVTAEMDQPIKALTRVIRHVPRGQVSAAGNEPIDPPDNELLDGFPCGGGDPARRPRLAAPSRARRRAPWHALHRLRVQRLRPHARDCAVGGDAHPPGPRAPLPPSLGRPLLLGLSAVPRFRSYGWRGGAEA